MQISDNSCVESFIKRYEQETKLLETVYFKEHGPFVRYLPGFFSSALYAAHLITFIWGWKTFRKRKVYRDIRDKEADYALRHFSNKEIRLVKVFAINVIIFVVSAVCYYYVKFFWPEILA